MGLPDWFRVELGIAKLLGALALVAPLGSSPWAQRLKEWVYVGFGINLVSAPIAHLAVGDPVAESLMPVIFLGLLVLSYRFYHQLLSAPAAK
ncbi:MAG: DoxX family protein [Bacteroidia bacterium]|nr:DoxX family protein [Bacteroidia bacterium]